MVQNQRSRSFKLAWHSGADEMKPSRHRHAIPRQLPKLRNLGSHLAWSKQRSKRLIIKIKVTSNGRDSFSRDLFPIHRSVTFLNSVATDTCSSFTGEREYTTGQISVVMGPQFLFLIFIFNGSKQTEKKTQNFAGSHCSCLSSSSWTNTKKRVRM